MLRSLTIWVAFLVTLVGLPAVACAADGGDSAAQARKLFLTGHYAEAAELYAKLPEPDSPQVAIGLARCYAAQGEYDKATKVLDKAAEQHPQAAELPAELAELALARGDHDAARKLAAAALKLDSKQLAARWVQAEVERLSGNLEAAGKGYEWFIDYYNATDEFDDPRALHYVGLGAAQFARWNRLPDQFSYLVNTLYPDALELDEQYWPARLEAGRLFLEKYNQAEANRELKAALAINASAAGIHAALAELAIQNYELEAAELAIRQALAINPRHLGALRMKADLHLSNFDAAAALRVLQDARPLNPRSEETLGRLAAVYAILDGTGEATEGTRAGEIIAEVTGRNAHCGGFYFALAEALDKYRKFPDAARYFMQAVHVMPQHVGARGQAGLMYMRLGEEPLARKLLEESFDIDPFNVRVSNSIKVLEVLDDYATLETEHFIIRYDKEKDAILARYAADYLESIFPELCRRLAFQPQEKSLFEVFNRARNTDGHGWFSARMVGLPAIHTIGACSGKIVALTSPTSTKQRFNWARVLRHEFVHVINLQQTDFNIPHWFTEGLAVLLEEGPRPETWDEMLVRRVGEGKCFNLDTINLGFIRPTSGEDWQMAYCQAEMYAEYMIERFGEDAPGKMLAAYHDHLSTTRAIERCFGLKQEEFECGYEERLKRIVAELTPAAASKQPELSLAELTKRHEQKPDDVDLAAQLAIAHLQRKAYPQAGKLADDVLERQPKHQQATYVKARLLLLIGQGKEAYSMLEDCLDRERPQLDALRLLAGLKLKAEDYAGAALLYELGRKQEPANLDWTKLLARVYLASGDDQHLATALVAMAKSDSDDLAIRKKLAELAMKAKQPEVAADWANQCIHIDVMDPDMHQLLADALGAQKQFSKAVAEYEVALQIAPDRHTLRMALAKTHVAAGEPDKARAVLRKLLEAEPDYPEAKALLESLPKPDKSAKKQ